MLHTAIATVCILLPVNAYKKLSAGYFTIGNALVIGVVVGALGGFIYALYTYYHYDMINPEFITERLTVAKSEMSNSDSQATEEQIEQAIYLTEMIISPIGLSILAFIGAMIETFLVSLVIGLIKKNS